MTEPDSGGGPGGCARACCGPGDSMALYRWQGRNREGRLLRGEMEAADRAAVTAELRRRGVRPLASGIREKGAGTAPGDRHPGARAQGRRRRHRHADAELRRHDRGRRAHRRVPPGARRPDRQRHGKGSAASRAPRRVQRHDADRGHVPPSQAVRHPVRAHGGGRRAWRRAAGDPRAAGAVHRAFGAAQAQGQDRHALSRHRHRRGRGGGGGPSPPRDPGLRGSLPGHGAGPPSPDGTDHRGEPVDVRAFPVFFSAASWPRPRRFTWPAVPREAGGRSIVGC